MSRPDWTDATTEQEDTMNTTSTDRKLIAWATTTRSMPEADPGILVTSVDREDPTDVAELVTSDAQAPYWATTQDDGLDVAAADQLLAGLGYRRAGDWTPSDNAWAAEVEPT